MDSHVLILMNVLKRSTCVAKTAAIPRGHIVVAANKDISWTKMDLAALISMNA